MRAEQRRIERRLAEVDGGREPRGIGPELSARTIRYECASRMHAIPCGGIGAMRRLAVRVGLIDALGTRLPILKCRRPYSEADHVMNIVYNVLCGGHVLDDIEVRRNDAAFLDALGARTRVDCRGAERCHRSEPQGHGQCYLHDPLHRHDAQLRRPYPRRWSQRQRRARIRVGPAVVRRVRSESDGLPNSIHQGWNDRLLLLPILPGGGVREIRCAVDIEFIHDSSRPAHLRIMLLCRPRAVGHYYLGLRHNCAGRVSDGGVSKSGDYCQGRTLFEQEDMMAAGSRLDIWHTTPWRDRFARHHRYCDRVWYGRVR